jgi:hypothetical protein
VCSYSIEVHIQYKSILIFEHTPKEMCSRHFLPPRSISLTSEANYSDHVLHSIDYLFRLKYALAATKPAWSSYSEVASAYCSSWIACQTVSREVRPDLPPV